jgi:iron(III) transport system permease protein
MSTLTLTVTVTIMTLALGITTAWLTTRTDLAGAKVWSTLMTLPLVIPSYVGAMAMLGASGNNGMVSRALETIGFPGLPVLKGFWAAWLALSLWNFSFVHLLTVPVLRRLDPALEDVARGLGAGRRRVFMSVVLPQLRPVMAASALLVSLYVLSDFGAVSMLRYETFTRAIYTQFAGRLDTGPALFLAGLLSTAALIIVIVQMWLRGRTSLYPNRPARPPKRHRLTWRGRALTWALLGSIVTLALVLPLATMLWWTVRGIDLGNTPLSVFPHVGRSLLISGVAAVVIALAAVPLGVLAGRYPRRSVRVLESVPWLTYSLPHLAIGLAYLVIVIRVARPLYQTPVLLVIVYLAMFLPVALAAVESGIRRVAPGLEEVSRSLGWGSWATLRRITIPMMRGSILAGAALVFLSVMKELPATLLLRPTGFDTLPVRVWSATEELFFTQASFAALALVAVSAVPLYLFVVRDLHD